MSYQQNRVYVRDYASLPDDSPLLAPVPTAPGHKPQKAHVLVVRALVPMSSYVQARLGFPLLVASGKRRHRWASVQAYEDELVKQYAAAAAKKLGHDPTRAEIVAYGREYLAFWSAHETGLALDFGCGGLEPVSATIAKQKKTKLWQLLHDHASDFGFTPYFPEPWHWELHVARGQYWTPPALTAPHPGNFLLGLPSKDPPEHECCEDESCLH